MIVKIANVIPTPDLVHNCALSRSCYQIIDKGYETLETAYRAKEKIQDLHTYIITPYWD